MSRVIPRAALASRPRASPDDPLHHRRLAFGVDSSLLRLSVGLEDRDELIADQERALEAVALPMIGASQEELLGPGVSGAQKPVIFAMSAPERTRVPFACSLRVSHVPAVIPVPCATHPAAQRQFLVVYSGLAVDPVHGGASSQL